MPKRAKDEDKIEKVIRGLHCLPENRRCINCNNLGPQYICTTFWTFVCTSCSGVHREFTHRVKSISMAKFTPDELGSLQAGGNKRAREIYFKDWDPQRHSYPDNSNLHKLREFIRHVYVDRKYCGATSSRGANQLSRLEVSDREDFYGSRRFGRPRSPCYSEKSSPGGRSDDRNFRHYYDDRRSPRLPQENSRYGSNKRNPVRFEVVDDRVRDNGQGSGRRSSREPKQEVKSIEAPPPKLQDECPSERQPAEVIRKEEKAVTSQSLIDFDADTEHSHSASLSQTHKNSPSSVDGDKRLDSSKNKVSEASNPNSLESLLFGLSVPTTNSNTGTPKVSTSGEAPLRSPVQDILSMPATSSPTTNVSTKNPEGTAEALQSAENELSLPTGSGGASTEVSSEEKSLMVLEQQPSASPSVIRSSPAQQTVPAAGILNVQQWLSLPAPNTQAPFGTSSVQITQAASKPAQYMSSGLASEPPTSEVTTYARKELPADLFTASYSPVPAQGLCWQSVPRHAMGFNTQYQPTVMHGQAFPSSAKSTNPFDLTDETTQPRDQSFMSLGLLQGALPNVPGPRSPGPAQPQFPYHASHMVLRQSYPSAMAQGVYMGDPASPNIQPARLQNFGNIGNSGCDNTNQHVAGRFSGTNSPNSFSSNPFG